MATYFEALVATGLDFVFFPTSNSQDYVWDSGFRAGRIPMIHPENVPGANLYGSVLRKVYLKVKAGTLETDISPFTLPDLVTRICLPKPTYIYTCAMISDNFFRHVKYVAGGQCFVLSGGTCDTIISRLKDLFFCPMNYKLLIFMFGANHGRKTESEWKLSYRKFRQFIEPLKGHPQTYVLVTSAMGINEWPGVRSFTRFFQTKVPCRLRICQQLLVF